MGPEPNQSVFPITMRLINGGGADTFVMQTSEAYHGIDRATRSRSPVSVTSTASRIMATPAGLRTEFPNGAMVSFVNRFYGTDTDCLVCAV